MARKIPLTLAFPLMLGALVSNSYAWQADIYVKCNSTLQGNSQITIHKVLCNKAIERQLNQSLQGLPNNQAIARAKSFTQMHLNALRLADNSNQQAINAGITKIPAVVINQHYVVYGTTNINQALRWLPDSIA